MLKVPREQFEGDDAGYKTLITAMVNMENERLLGIEDKVKSLLDKIELPDELRLWSKERMKEVFSPSPKKPKKKKFIIKKVEEYNYYRIWKSTCFYAGEEMEVFRCPKSITEEEEIIKWIEDNECPHITIDHIVEQVSSEEEWNSETDWDNKKTPPCWWHLLKEIEKGRVPL